MCTTPDRLDTLPKTVTVVNDPPDIWKCEIQAGSGDKWKCADPKTVPRGLPLQLILTSGWNAQHHVTIPILASETQSRPLGLFLAVAVNLVLAIAVLVSSFLSRKGFQKHIALVDGMMEEECTRISRWADAAKAETSAIAAQPPPREVPSREKLNEGTDKRACQKGSAAIEAAGRCLDALGIRNPGVEKTITELREAFSNPDPQIAAQKYNKSVVTLAKLILKAVDESGPVNQSAELGLKSLLDVAGLALFTPKTLEKFDPNRHMDVGHAQLSRDGMENCVAQVRCRGLLDAATGVMVERALVIIYSRF
jgi:hypothetical protein